MFEHLLCNKVGATYLLKKIWTIESGAWTTITK
jgi:hypothetical protein